MLDFLLVLFLVCWIVFLCSSACDLVFSLLFSLDPLSIPFFPLDSPLVLSH